MFVAAAHAIASVIGDDERSADYIIPSVFDRRVVDAVKQAVMNAAVESGVARKRMEREEAVRTTKS
jgi:malate dehydrogenase (oxaloacetate-decarboxylating)